MVRGHSYCLYNLLHCQSGSETEFSELTCLVDAGDRSRLQFVSSEDSEWHSALTSHPNPTSAQTAIT